MILVPGHRAFADHDALVDSVGARRHARAFEPEGEVEGFGGNRLFEGSYPQSVCALTFEAPAC
jgi:hypothetical protein